MPGFDRDWVNDLLASHSCTVKSKTSDTVERTQKIIAKNYRKITHAGLPASRAALALRDAGLISSQGSEADVHALGKKCRK